LQDNVESQTETLLHIVLKFPVDCAYFQEQASANLVLKWNKEKKKKRK